MGITGDMGRRGDVEEMVSNESVWSTEVDSVSQSQFTSVSWFLLSCTVAEESNLVASEHEEGVVTECISGWFSCFFSTDTANLRRASRKEVGTGVSEKASVLNCLVGLVEVTVEVLEEAVDEVGLAGRLEGLFNPEMSVAVAEETVLRLRSDGRELNVDPKSSGQVAKGSAAVEEEEI